MDENEERNGEQLNSTDTSDVRSDGEAGEEANAEGAPEVVTEVSVSENRSTEDGGAADKVEPPKKQKRAAKIFWNIFLVVVIVLGILSVFGITKEIDPDAEISFVEAMRGASPLFMCVLVLVLLVIMVLDTSKYAIISKTVTGKYSIATSAKVNFLGKYYDAVTPFSTGGQPMQIYYLNTKGISGGNSTAIVLIKYFSGIICWVFLGAALMIWGTAQGILSGVSQGKWLIIAGWLGIAVNLVLPLFITLCLIFPKFMYKLVRGIVKLGAKIKIVKDVEGTTERAFKVVKDFQNSFKLMATTPVKLVALLLVSIIEAYLTFAVPYFVMMAFNSPVGSEIFMVMALNAFAIFGAMFIPTPGNSGAVESLGALAFSVAAGSVTVWAVLFWRLCAFYVYIIIGLGITVFDIIQKNKKKKNVSG